LEEFEDAGFGDGGAVLDVERDGYDQGADDEDGLDEEGCQPRGGLEDLFHELHGGDIHCIAWGKQRELEPLSWVRTGSLPPMKSGT